MPYAQGTDVPVDRSKVEIERTLRRFGADDFGYREQRKAGGAVAMVSFGIDGRFVRFALSMPSPTDPSFTLTPTGRERSTKQAEAAWEQACREQWRALAAVIKAKLVAVEAGISTVEQEFLAWIALPNGRTVGEETAPAIERAYAEGKHVPLLELGAGA